MCVNGLDEFCKNVAQHFGSSEDKIINFVIKW